MFYVLLSFAATVIVTRAFLKWTGYPQIATGDFHIAHVLWGGLLLFAASLLLLIWRGQNMYRLSSILTGAGFGLFIDEVGKFITQDNDYFYPLAAPIIYAFFMLTVLIYVSLQRLPREESSADIYRIADSLTAHLDANISAEEKANYKRRLHAVIARAEHPIVVRLAKDALQLLEAEDEARVGNGRFLERLSLRLRTFASRWLSQPRLRRLLFFGFILLGLRNTVAAIATMPLFTMALFNPDRLQQLLVLPWADSEPFGMTRFVLFMLALVLEGLIGVSLLMAAALLWTKRDGRGMALGYWTLLFNLAVIHLLVFYFNQFDAISTTVLQFALFAGVAYYHFRYNNQGVQVPSASR